MVTSPLPSWEPKRGGHCYTTQCIIGGPQRQGHGENQKLLPHPCLLGPRRGQKCYVTTIFSGVPNAMRVEKAVAT